MMGNEVKDPLMPLDTTHNIFTMQVGSSEQFFMLGVIHKKRENQYATGDFLLAQLIAQMSGGSPYNWRNVFIFAGNIL